MRSLPFGPCIHEFSPTPSPNSQVNTVYSPDTPACCRIISLSLRVPEDPSCSKETKYTYRGPNPGTGRLAGSSSRSRVFVRFSKTTSHP